jgi:hypothetical protein
MQCSTPQSFQGGSGPLPVVEAIGKWRNKVRARRLLLNSGCKGLSRSPHRPPFPQNQTRTPICIAQSQTKTVSPLACVPAAVFRTQYAHFHRYSSAPSQGAFPTRLLSCLVSKFLSLRIAFRIAFSCFRTIPNRKSFRISANVISSFSLFCPIVPPRHVNTLRSVISQLRIVPLLRRFAEGT